MFCIIENLIYLYNLRNYNSIIFSRYFYTQVIRSEAKICHFKLVYKLNFQIIIKIKIRTYNV